MSVRVALPPGNEGFTGPGGWRSPDTRPGGTITVSDEVARKIEGQYGGDGGLVQARQRVFLGTKNGRWCKTCSPARLWNSWQTECPKGHGPTEPE